MAPPPFASAEILGTEKLYSSGNSAPLTAVRQFDDGREHALHDYVVSRPASSLESLRNNPAAVVAAIDEYAQTNQFLMTLGQHKLKVVRDLLERMHPRPKVIVELGTYIGYSAVAFGAMMKDLHRDAVSIDGLKVYSLELDPRWAKIAQDFVDLAGVNDVVEIVVGPAAESIQKLHSEGKLPRVDVLLIDHWEKLYIEDLQVCEELGLLHEGAIVLADNVIVPGAPEYLEYVRSGGKGKVRYESNGIESMIPNGCRDVLEVSRVVNMFGH